MCTRNFDLLKDGSEKDKKIVMEYLKGKSSKASRDNTTNRKKK